MQNKKGLTLIEVIIAMALVGIIAVSMIPSFGSIFKMTVDTKDITVESFDAQGSFERAIYEVKSALVVQPIDISRIDGASIARFESMFGYSGPFFLCKYTQTYPDNANKNMIVFLSDMLAVKDIRLLLSATGVHIRVSPTKLNNNIATLAAGEYLKGFSDQPLSSDWARNNYKWFVSNSGNANPRFPEDYEMISSSIGVYETKTLSAIEDYANRYVVFQVTPIDFNGLRGIEGHSQPVYIRGDEWRSGVFAWADKTGADGVYNENLAPSITDVELFKTDLFMTFDMADGVYHEPNDFDTSVSSLYVPIRLKISEEDTPDLLIPGDQPSTSRIDWISDKSIHLANNLLVENNTDINMYARNGNITLYQFIDLSSGDVAYVDEFPVMIDKGPELRTSGDISLTAKGNMTIQQFSDLASRDLDLVAHGAFGLYSGSTITAGRNLTIDTTLGTSTVSRRIYMTGASLNLSEAYTTGRRILIKSTDSIALADTTISDNGSQLSSLIMEAHDGISLSETQITKMNIDLGDDVTFTGGGWSYGELKIPNGRTITFEAGAAKVSNLGTLNLGDTGGVDFANSMNMDLASLLRIDLTEIEGGQIQISTNYGRTVDYADSDSAPETISIEGAFQDLGSNRSNLQYTVEKIPDSGDGEVSNIGFQFDKTSRSISIIPNATEPVDGTYELTIRDKYARNAIARSVAFSISATGEVTDIGIIAASYTVTFDNNRGQGSGDVTVITAPYGETIDLPANPTKTGYAFINWNTEPDGSGYSFTASTPVVANITVYAKYVTEPTATITSSVGSPTNVNAITYTIQFSEEVIGFTIDDVIVTNGSKGTFTRVDGDTYTLVVNYTIDGSQTVGFSAGVCTDALLNENLAPETLVVIIDKTSPTATITPNVASPTIQNRVIYTIQFNEAVTGFDVTDINVTNGTKGTFTRVDASTYTLSVNYAGDGNQIVGFNAGVCADQAGNPNTAPTPATVLMMRDAPTATITPSVGSPTSASTITYTIQFSKAVTGFENSDITVDNGTKGAFNAVDADTYTLVVDFLAEGNQTVSFLEDVCIDGAGIGNALPVPAVVMMDRTSPTAVITADHQSPSNASSIIYTIQFSEAVTGFVTGDISLTNGTKGTFTPVDGDTYRLTVNYAANGNQIVGFSAGVCSDLAGNGNLAPESVTILMDRTAPTATITAGVTSPSNASSVTYTIQFSEAVIDFESEDLIVTNGSKGDFTVVDADTYTQVVNYAVDGNQTVGFSAGVCTDLAGNNNTMPTSAIVRMDRSAPVATITANDGSPSNNSSITYTIQFNEDVTGFDTADVVVTNGTKGTFNRSDANTYTLVVTYDADGNQTVEFDADVCLDLAGNGNLAPTPRVVLMDRTQPTATITADDTSPSNATTITYTIQFSEAVTGFATGDLSTSNGSKSNFVVVDADTYTVRMTYSNDGNQSVGFNAGACTDLAGNNNIAPTTRVVLMDKTAPTATITANVTSPSNATSIIYTIQFTEAVSGFETTDINVTNGTKSTFTEVDTDTYTIAVTYVANGNQTVGFNANVCTDLAGNNNTTPTTRTILMDRTAPTATITAGVSSPSNAASITYTIQFNEDVTGFSSADIDVINGTKSTFTTVDANTYRQVVNYAADGNQVVDFNAGVCTDLAGNGNTAPTAVTISIDRTAPTATITAGTSSPSNDNSIIYTIQFSEPVTGFTTGDITVTNGSKSTFTTTDADTYTLLVNYASDGNQTVDFNANVCLDSVGNGNAAPTAEVVLMDKTAPTVTITADHTSPTNADSITYTIHFSEAVTGFESLDISVTNGSKGTFTSTAADTYTQVVNYIGNGNQTVSLSAGVCTDLAGNGNTASATMTIVMDKAAPTLAAVTIASNNANAARAKTGNTVTLSITGSEALATPTVTIAGHTAIVTGSGTTWSASTIMVAGDTEGQIAFSIAYSDVAGNAGTPVTTTTNGSLVTFDRTAPTLTTVTIASNNADTARAKAGDRVTLSIAANDSLATAPMVTIAGRAATVTGSGTTWSAYTIMAAGDTDGTIGFSISGYGDATGNIGTTVTTTTNGSLVSFDRTAPTCGVSFKVGAATVTSVKSGAVVVVTATFNEDMLSTQNVQIVGSGPNTIPATSMTRLNARTYTYNWTVGSGNALETFTVSLGRDLASNVMTTATGTITVDNTAPTCSVVFKVGGSVVTVVKSGTVVEVSATFNEDMLSTQNVQIVGSGPNTIPATSMTRVDARTYTYNWTVGAGNTTETFTASLGQDLAGNTMTPGVGTILLDNTAPTVTTGLSTTNNSYVIIGGATPVNIVFSEVLSTQGQTNVQAAITAGSNRALTYAWTGATLSISRATNNATIANDVFANLIDLAGNTTNTALLINSNGN